MKNVRTVAALTVFIAAAVALTLVLILPGYASLTGSSYNEHNSTDVRYITMSLGESQYSSAVSSTMSYHTVIDIDSGGRNVTYVPEHDETITVSETDIEVKEVVTFNISMNASDVIPTYTLHIEVDDATKMTGDFYIKYTVGAVSTNMAFDPSTGVSFSPQTAEPAPASSLTVTLYVHSDESSSEPVKPLDDVAFRFRAEVTS